MIKKPRFSKLPRILIVEDNQINVVILRDMLESLGFRVDVAMNGKEAINKFITYKYDSVFMDIELPDLSGYQVTAKIRIIEKSLKNSRTPIFGLSARIDKEKTRQECIDSGMDEFFIKPLSFDVLKDLITVFINK